MVIVLLQAHLKTMGELNLKTHNGQYPFQGMVDMDSLIGIPNS